MSLASLLPPSPTGGILPYWMLLISSAAFYNVAQSYIVLWQTKEIYGKKPEQVTPLTSRLLGTWNLLSAIIRFKHAYNITDPSLYGISHVTFMIAAAHFGSELLIFRTVKINRASIWPLLIGSSSSIWMYLQKDHYLGL